MSRECCVKHRLGFKNRLGIKKERLLIDNAIGVYHLYTFNWITPVEKQVRGFLTIKTKQLGGTKINRVKMHLTGQIFALVSAVIQ